MTTNQPTEQASNQLTNQPINPATNQNVLITKSRCLFGRLETRVGVK
jgi:hypothetical protein